MGSAKEGLLSEDLNERGRVRLSDPVFLLDDLFADGVPLIWVKVLTPGIIGFLLGYDPHYFEEIFHGALSSVLNGSKKRYACLLSVVSLSMSTMFPGCFMLWLF